MNSGKRTSNGRPVTDDQIDTFAGEAENGFDVDKLRRTTGRKPMGSAAARVVPVRLDPELEEALRHRAEVDHSNASETIRDALRAWLETA